MRIILDLPYPPPQKNDVQKKVQSSVHHFTHGDM